MAERMVTVNAVDLKIILDLYEKGDTTSWPDADVALERLYQALNSSPNAASEGHADDTDGHADLPPSAALDPLVDVDQPERKGRE